MSPDELRAQKKLTEQRIGEAVTQAMAEFASVTGGWGTKWLVLDAVDVTPPGATPKRYQFFCRLDGLRLPD